MDEKNVSAIRRRIAKIKEALLGLGDLRPGSLSQQYNVCGKPGCRCKANPPIKHGPYYQLGWTRKGKSTTRFVRGYEVAEVQRQIANYERLQALIDEWVDLSMQLCELSQKAARAAKAE